jgi:hypothetical protein
VQVAARGGERAVAHDGLNRHEVYAGCRQQRAVGVPEVVPKRPRLGWRRLPRVDQPADGRPPNLAAVTPKVA